MRPFIIVAFLLQFFLSARSQDKDSFVRAIDSSSKAINTRIQQLEDSLYQLEMKRSIDQQGKNLDRFLADMKEREKREQRQLYIRIALGVAFLALLVVGLARRRKNKIRE